MTTDLHDVDTATAKELLRAEIRARGFPPMTDAALADARERYRMAHHNNAIEGIVPDQTTAALMEVLFEERVALAEWGTMVAEFIVRHTADAEAPAHSVA